MTRRRRGAPVQDHVRSSSTTTDAAPGGKPKSEEAGPGRSCRWLVIDNHALIATRRRIQTGFSSTCFFLPSESFTSLAVASVAGENARSSLSTAHR